MKKHYVTPCVEVVNVHIDSHLMDVSGNLNDMERGSSNVFGGGDDWDAKENDNDYEPMGWED